MLKPKYAVGSRLRVVKTRMDDFVGRIGTVVRIRPLAYEAEEGRDLPPAYEMRFDGYADRFGNAATFAFDEHRLEAADGVDSSSANQMRCNETREESEDAVETESPGRRIQELAFTNVGVEYTVL